MISNQRLKKKKSFKIIRKAQLKVSTLMNNGEQQALKKMDKRVMVEEFIL